MLAQSISKNKTPCYTYLKILSIEYFWIREQQIEWRR